MERRDPLDFAGSSGKWARISRAAAVSSNAGVQWRVLSKRHDLKNLAEYEGQSEIDAKLLAELVRIATELEAAILALPTHKT